MKKSDKIKMLIWDVLAWIVRIDSWRNLRKKTKSIIKIVNVMTRSK